MHNTQLERLSANAEWVPVAHSLSRLCNSWAKRHDLVVYLGRDGGQGMAPAFFNPDTAEIEINSTLAFGQTEASTVGDLTDRIVLSQYPVAGGVALHEAMHARFSKADWKGIRNQFTNREWDVFTLLEESRVEKNGVALFPRDAGYLRASARAIIMSEGMAEKSPRFSAQAVYGRRAVGVLTSMDVLPVASWLLSNGWTQDILDQVEAKTIEFSSLSDDGYDLSRQIELAKELDKLMPIDPASGDSDEENGDLSGLASAISEALGKAERGGMSDVFEEAERVQAENDRAEAQRANDVQEANERKANVVFRSSDGSHAPVPSELEGSRHPTSEERSAAVVLAQSLEMARYRDRDIQEFWSEIPPGRLHGGEAMRLTAARWAGAPTSGYRPFKKQKRMETEEPKLTVGIMCDTSGSMSALQPLVGSATWVISDAVWRIDRAEAAQVYFGRDVKPGLRKGEHLREVRTWKGGGAYEDFDGAFRALDGELNLINGSGARLLFVISDGEYKTGPGVNQIEASRKWTKTCADNGIAVVWIQLRGQNYLAKNSGVEVVDVDPKDFMSATREIGQACIRTLAEVSGVDSGGW